MKLSVRNYIALGSAEIELAPLAIVAGPNRAGKTSLALATAAVLLGKKVLIDGILESEAGMLIRTGEAKALIEITGPNGSARMGLPAAKLQTTGQPPRASAFALGVRHLMNLDPKQRTLELIEACLARPARSDLVAYLPECGPEDIDRLVRTIKAVQWDGAAAEEADRGKLQKGQWHQVTGEQWGSQKALSWLPQGWEADLNSASLDSLQQAATDAQSMLEAAISQSAIGGEERQRLEGLASGVPGLILKIENQEITVHDCARLLDEARAARDALPAPEEATDPHAEERERLSKRAHSLRDLQNELDKIVLSALETKLAVARKHRESLPLPGKTVSVPEGTAGKCPSCGADILFSTAGEFCHPVTPTTRRSAKIAAEQNQARVQAMEQADAEIANLQDDYNATVERDTDLRRSIESAELATAALAALPPAPDLEAAYRIAYERRRLIAVANGDVTAAQQVHDNEQRKLGALEADLKTAQAAATKLQTLPADAVTDQDVNAHKEQVRLATQRIEMFKKKDSADRLARSIALNQKIVAALGPKGVREAKLASAIGQFNERLATLCKAAGWKPVEFDSDLRISYAGHDWRMLSTGTRYLVQCVLQAALAQLDGSQLIIFDAADVLDSGKAKDGINQGRPGLLALARHLGLSCLITMTMKLEEAQKLGTALPVYWLEGGVAQQITTARAAA